MILVRRERIYSIQRLLKCARRVFKLYLFTEVYYVCASLVSVRAAQHKSVNECSELK